MYWTATFYKKRSFGADLEIHVETFDSDDGWDDVRVWEKVHALHVELEADAVRLAT